MLINRNDVVRSGGVELPYITYRVRIIGAVFNPKNSKGLPQVELKAEIVFPEKLEIKGAMYNIAGEQFTLYAGLSQVVVKKKSPWEITVEFMDKLGVETPEQFNTDHVKEYFVGWEFDMPLSSELTEVRRRVTDEERAQGITGETLKDAEGNPVMGRYQIKAALFDVLPNCNPRKTEIPYS